MSKYFYGQNKTSSDRIKFRNFHKKNDLLFSLISFESSSAIHEKYQIKPF